MAKLKKEMSAELAKQQYNSHITELPLETF